jgi:hypothetical protein
VARSKNFIASQLDDPARWREQVDAASQRWAAAASPDAPPGAGGGGYSALRPPAATRPGSGSGSGSGSAARQLLARSMTALRRGSFFGPGPRPASPYEELGDEKCERTLNIVTGAAFWRRLSAGIEVICVGELRGALLAHSALGCPGVSTLLANLCSTIGDEHSSLRQVGLHSCGSGRRRGGWDGNLVRGAGQPGASEKCPPGLLTRSFPADPPLRSARTHPNGCSTTWPAVRGARRGLAPPPLHSPAAP